MEVIDKMEITQIKYFLDVAKTQHITQSAQRLHIAQPALSQAIKRLERELGVPLFERKGRNIVLTKYGEYLKTQLTAVDEKLEAIPTALQKMAKINTETIHLNLLAASQMMIDAVIEYKKHNDKINFQLLQGNGEDVPDIEVTTKMFYQISEEKSAYQFSVSEKIFLAVPNSNEFENKTSVKLKDVADQGFISLMGSKQLRYICDKYCQHAGINPKIVFESDSPSAVRNMIGANLGIGFWPEFTWGRIEGDNVKLLEISDPNCKRDIVFTCNPIRLENDNVRDFFEFLKQYVKIKSA